MAEREAESADVAVWRARCHGGLVVTVGLRGRQGGLAWTVCPVFVVGVMKFEAAVVASFGVRVVTSNNKRKIEGHGRREVDHPIESRLKKRPNSTNFH